MTMGFRKALRWLLMIVVTQNASLSINKTEDAKGIFLFHQLMLTSSKRTEIEHNCHASQIKQQRLELDEYLLHLLSYVHSENNNAIHRFSIHSIC